MNVGTKSILFGVHAFWYHPFVVARAWKYIYSKWPSWEEWICIFFHDVDYWGKPNMDGAEGRRHPEGGARIVCGLVKWFGGNNEAAYQLTLYHSSHYARFNSVEPSALYLPDKVSILFEPRWWYLLRAKLSGEVHEYVDNSPLAKLPPELRTPEAWVNWYKSKVRQKLQHYEKTHPCGLPVTRRYSR